MDVIVTNIGSEDSTRKINPKLTNIGWNNEICILLYRQFPSFGVQDYQNSYSQSSFSFYSDSNSSYASDYEELLSPENSTKSMKGCSDQFSKKLHNFEVTFFATSFILPIIVLTFCYISIYQEVVSIQKGLTAIGNKKAGNWNN